MLLAAVLVALAGTCGILWWQSTHGLLVSRLRKEVVVTLKSGSAFRGLLAAADRDAVVLVSATFVKAAEAVPVDGEVIVLRADIDFLQRP